MKRASPPPRTDQPVQAAAPLAVTRAADFIGIDPVEPIEGGGTFGFVPVNLKTPLDTQYGGTGATNINVARHNLFNMAGSAVGDIYVRSSAAVVNRLAIGQIGEVLRVSAARLPEWASVGGVGGIDDGVY